jgi:outer membrane translocation and assembly module TamA
MTHDAAAFEYKVLHLTDHLDKTTGADLSLEIEAKLGYEVQQVFTRHAGEGEFVYALLRRARLKEK